MDAIAVIASHIYVYLQCEMHPDGVWLGKVPPNRQPPTFNRLDFILQESHREVIDEIVTRQQIIVSNMLSLTKFLI